jgi:flagellar protein FlaG
MEIRTSSIGVKTALEPSTIQQSDLSVVMAPPPIHESYSTANDLLHKDKYDLSVSDQAIRKAIERANKALEGINRHFEYSVHQKTGEVIIKVINQETDEVVREIPNEKFLDMMAKLQELVGLNIDEKR